MTATWEHPSKGLYTCEKIVLNERLIRAEVFQDGERWVSRVYFCGELVDLGEWPGRDSAIRNVYGGMDRVVALRSLQRITKDTSEGSDDE